MVRTAFRTVLSAATDAELGFYIVRGNARSQGFGVDRIDADNTGHVSQAPVLMGDVAVPRRLGEGEITEETDTDGVDRRELLRLLTTAGAFVGAPLNAGPVDWERIAAAADRSRAA
ncbi:hypothetical protein KIF24_16720 [Micromonospora sp. Llam7]|uniref:hypothetical protein n=1 Tax=Micromonospora tarapacensis TaxID=2835305 RepID=UPI001C836F28|nr:hypothetical protein [Micromonospora tarapacensis]MBX7267509.1 hypothetical protein [Micromonospora tarapacensis]